MIGLFIADKFERKTVIMAASALIAVFGLVFSRVSSAVLLIAMGVALTLANNTLSFSFHAYQTELFPTQIRATAVGFVYSWSRFSAIFTSFLIASTLNAFGTTGVFLFIAGSMAVVILAIGWMGPRTRDLGLETVSQ
jgi:putative MFS transporter